MALMDVITGSNKQFSASEINAKKISLVSAFEEKAASGKRTMIIGAILVITAVILFCTSESYEDSLFGYSYTAYSASWHFAWFTGIPGLITILVGYNKRSKNQAQADKFSNMDDATFVAYLKDKQNAENLANIFKGAKTVVSLINLVSQL